jgi:hypothetical protein
MGQHKMLDRKKLRLYILSIVRQLNPKYTKVSDEFLSKVEEDLLVLIKERVLFCKEDGKILK